MTKTTIFRKSKKKKDTLWIQGRQSQITYFLMDISDLSRKVRECEQNLHFSFITTYLPHHAILFVY